MKPIIAALCFLSAATAEARVIVNVGAAPVYGPAPMIVAPTTAYVPTPNVESVAPAPMQMYYSAPVVRYSAPMVRSYSYSYAAPVVRSYAVRSVVVDAGPSGAQRRHARKAAWHALRAAYWASRS